MRDSIASTKREIAAAAKAAEKLVIFKLFVAFLWKK